MGQKDRAEARAGNGNRALRDEGEMRWGWNGGNALAPETFSTERDPLYVQEHESFFEAIGGRLKPESTVADALISMQVIAASLV